MLSSAALLLAAGLAGMPPADTAPPPKPPTAETGGPAGEERKEAEKQAEKQADKQAQGAKEQAQNQEAAIEEKEQPPPPLHVFGDVAGDLVHLFSWENTAVAAGGLGIAAAVHHNDPKYTRDLADKAFLRKASKPGSVIGSVEFELGLSTTFYLFGRLGDRPKIAHIGWDLIRGQAVSQLVTQSIKYAVDRERPDGTRHGFPSGHASTTFATASVLHQHYGWGVGVPAYTIASYVALSRLPRNRHYLGDVVFGSAVGIIAGRTVTLHERRARKVAFEPLATPDGVGVGVVVSLGPRVR